MKKTVLMVVALMCTFACFAQVVDFEDLELAPNSAWTGVPGPEDGDGSSFTSSYLTLYNINISEWNYWEGFAYTNGTDSETYGYTNNSAVAGHGNANSANYVTCYMGWYDKAGIKINTANSGSFENRGAYFCLPTYVSGYVDNVEGAYSNFIANHSYFSVKITAYADGTELENRDVVMADFRGDLTYKMDDWTYVDLSWIDGADSLYFEAVTDDGMTPYYFCMDDFGAQDPSIINYTEIVDFEDLTLSPNSSWIGDADAEDGSTFQSSYMTLYNYYMADWGYWEGFAYTNGTDTETNSSSNLSSCVGHGADNSENYVTSYMGWYNMSGVKIDREHCGNFENRGAYFCMPVLLKKYVVGNASEYYYASHQFYFKVKASAYANGTLVDEREIMMADFTEGHSYMMDDWTYVDFSWIANADSLYFTAMSNDTAGGYGINTPLYFCMDNFGAENPNPVINYTEIVDFEELELEPNSYWYSTDEYGSFSSSYLTLYSYYDEDWAYWEGFAYTNGTDADTYGYSNLSAIAGSGNDDSDNYATCYMGWYGTSGVKIDTEHSVDFTNRGAYFCLPTYVSKYVDDENVSFAENHFYYSVKVTAFAGENEIANREIVMADFREDRTYKMDEWTFVDLSWIANADSLYFEAVGNDTAGGWGINTPTYFCMDDFGALNPGPVYVDTNFAEALSIDAYFDAAGILNLNCECRILDVCVYDMAGRLVKNVSANDNSVSMPVENRGMLIVSARTEKGMVVCKIINNR
ncbi:MAG: DUF4465 domain-containing protein [Bacteroidales bacterium]|nr:DUF4465 domain-containing protein [Bacteroidales bacterium]